MTPSWRQPAGMFGILIYIFAWSVLVASFSNEIGRLWWPLQAVTYLFLGLIWIAPLKPVLRWMEAGRKD